MIMSSKDIYNYTCIYTIYLYRVLRHMEIEIGNGGFMREKEVEEALVKAVKKRHGLALKFVSPGMSGVPDRLVLMPKGMIAFVELKAPGKKMRLLQEKRKSQLEALGFLVFCVDSKEKVEVVIDAILQTT